MRISEETWKGREGPETHFLTPLDFGLQYGLGATMSLRYLRGRVMWSD